MTLVFASNNKHKIKEINSLLGNEFNIIGLTDVGIFTDIPEDKPSVEGNALAKARYVHKATGRNVFADDTGLEIHSLNGMPGVHSARFAGESKDSDANIEKVLLMLKPFSDRKARFKTVIALIIDNKEFMFEGIVSGEIINEKRGYEGFGYDPVFLPEGRNLTFAEMDLAQKNKISHRARAFGKLKDFLQSY